MQSLNSSITRSKCAQHVLEWDIPTTASNRLQQVDDTEGNRGSSSQDLVAMIQAIRQQDCVRSDLLQQQ